VAGVSRDWALCMLEVLCSLQRGEGLKEKEQRNLALLSFLRNLVGSMK